MNEDNHSLMSYLYIYITIIIINSYDMILIFLWNYLTSRKLTIFNEFKCIQFLYFGIS